MLSDRIVSGGDFARWDFIRRGCCPIGLCPEGCCPIGLCPEGMLSDRIISGGDFVR